jgi:hypothetical protein
MSAEVEELLEKAVEEANEICGKEKWYSGGVCIDAIRRLRPHELEKLTFERAVEIIVCDTAYHDGTGFRG